MNIEEEIMEIANKYIIYLEDYPNTVPVIHKEDLADFVREIIEIIEEIADK